MICIPVVLTSTFIAPEGESVLFAQKLFGIMGATMLLQVTVGHRMPLVAGPAAILLMCTVSTTSMGASQGAVYGSMGAASLTLALLSCGKIMACVRKLFTSRVVVAILLLLSVTMIRPISGLLFSGGHHAGVLATAIATAVAMAMANERFRGIWKSSVVIIAMVLGSFAFYAATSFPSEFTRDTVTPHLMATRLTVDPGLVLAFVFCYMALFINEISSIESLGSFVEADRMTRRNRVGTLVTAAMNVVSGLLGVVGPVDYSLSPGVVASTQCASRHTMIPAAAAMVCLAFMPGVVSVLMTIPDPVMGMVLFYLMVTQVAAGLVLVPISRAAGSFRDGMVLGLPLLIDVLITFAPAEAFSSLPDIAVPIASNGFVMGIILVLVLEHVLLPVKK